MKKIYALILLAVIAAHGRLDAQVRALSSADTLQGCASNSLTVTFQELSTGNPTNYCWYFDDSSTVLCNTNGGTVTKTFLNPGVYNVRHWVYNSSSSDTEYILIRVFRGPQAAFESLELTGCAPHCAYFVNQTTVGESAIREIVWDYGDPPPTTNFNGYHCYTNPGSYQVSLLVRDFNGCESKLVKPAYITVRRRPRASLTANPAAACVAPQRVTLTATITTGTQGPYTYEFRMRGENTPAPLSFSPTASDTFPNGIWRPFVIVTDANGCKDTAFTLVEITDLVADFTASPLVGCVGSPIQFTDQSNFSAVWSWSFGDGTTASQRNPVKTYNTAGTYDVQLIIRYGFCRDTIFKPAYIRINPAPDFTFSAPQTFNCTVPFTVNFTATPTQTVITNYAWNFGDGSPVVNTTGTNVSHTYNSINNFTVSVTATNTFGCQRTVTIQNYVRIKNVTAGFNVDRDTGCAPLSVRFTTSSTGQAPLTYFWIFGDGNIASGNNPTHVYNNTDRYRPILVVTNGSGCRDTFQLGRDINVGSPIVPSFYADPLIQCVNQPVTFYNTTNIAGLQPPPTFSWQFELPKNNTVTGPAPYVASTTHTYTDTGCYDVRLSIISQGCRADTLLTRYICIVLPKADFEFKTNCMNTLMDTFRSKSEGADLYSWDFGSGPTPFSPSDSVYVHTFPQQGTYSVLHIVQNIATGCVDSIRKTVTVGVTTIGFRADTLEGCLPLRVRFTDTSIYANSWAWNFGDPQSGVPNNTSSQRNPTHTYNRAGLYTVQLIVNPGSGCPDTLIKTAYIKVNGATAAFQPAPQAGCVPLNVQFNDLSTAFMASIQSWSWNFGDPVNPPNTSTLQNPTHIYPNPGTYTVRLTVTDTNGCVKDTTRTVRAVRTTADFTTDTAICPGDPAVFNNLSTFANNFFWNFGDPGSGLDNTSTNTNPSHAYQNSGIYTVTLIAVNDTFGCSDTLRRNINISLPYVNFYDTSGFAPCPPFPVRFFNTSVLRPGYVFLWEFGDGGVDSVSFDPIHVFFFPGEYDVSLTFIDTNGTCRYTRTYEDLIRIQGPIGRFTASSDSGCMPLTVCINGNIQSTFSLVADMGNGVIIPYDNLQGQMNAPTVCYTYDSAGTYFPVFILRDSLNCTVAYPVDTIFVDIIPYPNLYSDTTVCEGNYVQFNLPEGDNFVWRSRPPPSYLSCEDCRNPVSSSPDTITYYVTASTAIGCFARDTVVLNVDPLPDVFPGLFYRICPGDTLQLFGGTGIDSAIWSPPMFIDDVNAFNPLVFPPDTMTYRVTAFNKTGCSISRVVDIYPISQVTGGISPRDTVVCEGAPVQFQAWVLEASVNDTSILWQPGRYLNSPILYNPMLRAPAGDYTYYVTISSSGCAPYNDSVHVVVAPYPNLDAGDNQTVSEGTTVTLWASSSGNVVYTWTPTFDPLSCTDCRMPSLTVLQSQYVYVEVTNTLGCSTRDSVYIRVVPCNESVVYVPNTFTPNGDGVNDVLYVRGAGLSQLDYFRIFDRWGSLVWETNDISQGWDGTIRGDLANTATFVYSLQAECSNGLKVVKQGNVTLVR